MRGSIGSGALALGMLLAGCDETSVATDAAAPEDAGGGEDAATPTGLVLSGVIVELKTRVTLPDLEVCIIDTDTCATTDRIGAFRLGGFPMATETAIVVRGDGIRPQLQPVYLEGPRSGIFLTAVSDDTLAAFETQLGETIDPSLAHVATGIRVDGTLDEGVPGATLALSPDMGTAATYMDASGALDPALTETTSGAFAGFLNLTPTADEVTITVTAPAGWTCETDSLHWPSSGLSMRAPLRAGITTGLWVTQCTDTP